MGVKKILEPQIISYFKMKISIVPLPRGLRNI